MSDSGTFPILPVVSDANRLSLTRFIDQSGLTFHASDESKQSRDADKNHRTGLGDRDAVQLKGGDAGIRGEERVVEVVTNISCRGTSRR